MNTHGDQGREGALVGAPRKRVAVEALPFDERGRLLIVRQTYKKDGWSLVGGIVEQFESIAAALRREGKEEIGISLVPTQLLVTDHRTDKNFSAPHHESLQLVMATQPLTPSDIARIRLQESELSAYKLVERDEARLLLRPRVFERVNAAWEVLAGNHNYSYLENGCPAYLGPAAPIAPA